MPRSAAAGSLSGSERRVLSPSSSSSNGSTALDAVFYFKISVIDLASRLPEATRSGVGALLMSFSWQERLDRTNLAIPSYL